jgi:hypothetical protein
MRWLPPRKEKRILSRAVSLRALVVVTALSALLASGVGFAAALAITPRALTVYTSPDTVPISTCTLTAPVADTYAHEGSSGGNFGTATTLHVRSAVVLVVIPDNKRSFVRFDLSSCSIPSSARVETARLKLFLSTAPGQNRTFQVHRVTAPWGETTLTWGNQPSVAGSVTSSVGTGTTSNVYLEWDVLADVRAFVDGTLTDNGWRVKDSTESSGSAFEGRFNSREHATAAQRPSLVVTYYP